MENGLTTGDEQQERFEREGHEATAHRLDTLEEAARAVIKAWPNDESAAKADLAEAVNTLEAMLGGDGDASKRPDALTLHATPWPQHDGANDPTGTHLQGCVDTSLATLRAVFGEPSAEYGDGKTRANWDLAFPDPDGEIIATIYDWKEEVPLENLTRWHIGGMSARALDKVAAQLADHPDGPVLVSVLTMADMYGLKA